MNDNIIYTLKDKNTGEYYYGQKKLKKAKIWLTRKGAEEYVFHPNSPWELVIIELKIK